MKSEDQTASATSTPKADTAEKQQKVLEKDLRARRNALYDAQLEAYGTNIDASLESAISRPDVGAVNEEPDFVLSHVGQRELPHPQSDREKAHYVHRAGVKVFHHCCALIAELKTAPPRFSTGVSRLFLTDFHLHAAQEDLVEYCSAYFECNPHASSVIGFAAAGPFWKWSVIQPPDLPRVNWMTKKVDKANDPKLREFHSKFGHNVFTLGTPESDKELSIISQEHIYPMLHDGHDTRR